MQFPDQETLILNLSQEIDIISYARYLTYLIRISSMDCGITDMVLIMLFNLQYMHFSVKRQQMMTKKLRKKCPACALLFNAVCDVTYSHVIQQAASCI